MTSDELREALERSTGRGIVSLTRRTSEYATSAPVEEVDAVLEGGESLALVLKETGRNALAAGALAAKPAFLADPVRERDVYERVLAAAGLGTARLYAADTQGDGGWLLLERVDEAVELFQVGERSTWETVAGWLAQMHETLRDVRSGRLLSHGEEELRRWLDRAVASAGSRRLAGPAACYDTALEMLLAAPRGFLHGEFYASNVLVVRAPTGIRVCPVDWETAGVGPQVLDLAALVAGWPEDDRAAIAAAYRAAAPDAWDGADFARTLDAARLQIALQWLGWSDAWTPPREHALDWFNEALLAAAALER